MSLHISVFLSEKPVEASGKMEVAIGERVDLVGESAQPNAVYKWVVKKGNDILSTQSSRNFNFKFDQQGEHTINLTATSGSKVENSTIKVLVGQRYPRPGAVAGDEPLIETGPLLRLDLQTLPHMDSEGRVVVLGDGKVRFDLSNSTGEILEYRIDNNVFEDTDGNGVANDDIDNVAHLSYLTGSSYLASYIEGKSTKNVAEVTLVDKSGKKVKQQVEIIFDSVDRTGDPVAILQSSPEVSEDSLIHLYGDPHRVGFYSGQSTGKIVEFRIDKNIFVDSDGDGNPANDIDNINDISFKTGDVWETDYDKTDDQVIAQLIVVGEGGKGSRIQKGIVFGEKPLPPAPPITEVATGIRLTADKEIVNVGDPITFTVEGLQLGLDEYVFEWDFDGDVEVDKEIEGISTVDHIFEEPGLFEVLVTISDFEGNSAERSLFITAKELVSTKADFEYTVDGNTLHFTNLSTADQTLGSQRLDYEWSFGDTDEAGFAEQRAQIGAENPVYTYNQLGTYLVTLTVTDVDQVTDSKSVQIEILTAAEPVESVFTDEPAKAPKGEGSLFGKLLKILLYLILIVIALVVVIVGGFLTFLKVQHPDLTFEELVDELKARILAKIGAHELAPPAGAPAPPAPTPTAPEAPAAEPEAEKAPTPEGGQAEPAPEPPVQQKGPVPDWLKGKDVIEGEIEETTPEASSPSEPTKDVPIPAEPAAPEAPVETEIPAPDESAPETKEKSDDDDQTPPPPPPSAGTAPDAGPTPETDAPASKKGPKPDWLKGV